MRGVATIVTKLLSLVRPDRGYFGEKDFEQLTLVRRLVEDLGLGVEIVGMPIVRESDGLAISSRNQRLDAVERQNATVLFRAISHGAMLLSSGSLALRELELEMEQVVMAEPGVTLDYATARMSHDLSIPKTLKGELRLVIAAMVGPVRLIDNISVTV
jgi:pantoate--beta-alanine ligase